MTIWQDSLRNLEDNSNNEHSMVVLLLQIISLSLLSIPPLLLTVQALIVVKMPLEMHPWHNKVTNNFHHNYHREMWLLFNHNLHSNHHHKNQTVTARHPFSPFPSLSYHSLHVLPFPCMFACPTITNSLLPVVIWFFCIIRMRISYAIVIFSSWLSNASLLSLYFPNAILT